MSDKLSYLICPLVQDHPSRVKGAVKRWCRMCEQKVWISPSGMKMVRHGVLIICTTCGKKQPGEFQPPTPEQLQEIEDELGTKPTPADIQAMLSDMEKKRKLP